MSDNISILVVEDEPSIRVGLRDFLEFHDFDVTEATDGLEAERTVSENSFDLILLDLMLPKISGEQLCRQWRQSGINTPIIMLTAKGLEKEKIAGLNLGADDYVSKPFSLEELLARITAILRRTDPKKSVGQNFTFGHLKIDIASLKARTEKNETAISKRQGQIIQFFAANPGRVISRDELYEKVWGESMGDLETRTVDMHIAKLRSTIEVNSAKPKLIKTIRGAGYLYETT
jgi:DNA-binding response OmpR family regulator